MKTRLLNYLITLIFVGLAGWAAVSLYHRYVENPWTRDGQVRANIVGIALAFPDRLFTLRSVITRK
jgi:multidrug resistance efflux pump